MSRMEGGGGRHHHHHHHHHGSSGLLSSPLVLALVASGTLAFVLLSWRWSSRLSVLQDSSTSSSSSTRNDAGAVGAQDEGLPPALAQQVGAHELCVPTCAAAGSTCTRASLMHAL